jgi:hypothetical protein
MKWTTTAVMEQYDNIYIEDGGSVAPPVCQFVFNKICIAIVMKEFDL